MISRLLPLAFVMLILCSCQYFPTDEAGEPSIRPTATPPTELTDTPLSFTPTSISIPVIIGQDEQGALYESVFTIPVGEQGVKYFGVDNPDALWTGPTAFSLAPDGSFYIADTEGCRVLRYRSNGILLGVINLEGQVVGIGDLEVFDDNVVVLDIAAMIPKVLRYSSEGALLARYDLPEGMRPESGLSGIALGDNGEILIELEGGAEIYQLADATGSYNPKLLEGYLRHGRVYKAETPYFWAGDIKLEMQFTTGLGGLFFLDANPDGSFYVTQDDVVRDSPIVVDQTVHYFSVEGKRLGIARMPLAEQFIYVPHSLAVGPDGTVYALLTHPYIVEVVRLNFFVHLDPLSPIPTRTP